MAHYALLNENNIVVNVIFGKDENEDGIDWEEYYSKETGLNCKRTSYNTVGNNHPTKKPFRKNYATIGGVYDEEKDAFIPIKDYPSWILDEITCRWTPPIPYPDDGYYYEWNEETLSWGEPLDTTP